MTYRHQCVAARGSHTCDGALDERSPELGALDTVVWVLSPRGDSAKVTVVLSTVLDCVPCPPSPNPRPLTPTATGLRWLQTKPDLNLRNTPSTSEGWKKTASIYQ